jgi:hypothetical protein
MKEYAGGGTNRQEKYFGYRLCSARNVIECSFGKLKARFGCLRRAMDINLADLPNVIYACFVLHNYCELNKVSVNDENIRSVIIYQQQFQQETVPNQYITDCNKTELGESQQTILIHKYFLIK